MENDNINNEYWRRCSACKHEIGFATPYQVCSVSTCQGAKGYVFCSVACWDSHLGMANHRSASAIEKFSPSHADYEMEAASNKAEHEANLALQHAGARRRVVTPGEKKSALKNLETLVVVSKVKKLIKDQGGFNTSQCAIDALTELVAKECLNAMERAQEGGRKTVMGRDF